MKCYVIHAKGLDDVFHITLDEEIAIKYCDKWNSFHYSCVHLEYYEFELLDNDNFNL